MKILTSARFESFTHGGEEKTFAYRYLAGTRLLESLEHPNGLTLTVSYENSRELPSRMRVARGATGVTVRDYAYDSVGRVLSRKTARLGRTVSDSFGYNTRSELVSAVLGSSEYAYDFDSIGNRLSSSEAGTALAYAANALNQYVSMGEAASSPLSSDAGTTENAFSPTYDLDGNMTLIQTSTGTWSVSYNAENRPVTWTNSAGEKICMIYDSRGRRAEKRVFNAAGTRTLRERYVYVGYTCVQILDGDDGNAVVKEFAWDPTEPVATKPLFMFLPQARLSLLYTHDGNKNVSDVCYLAPQNGVGAHYEYAPFGALTRVSKNTRVTVPDVISANPFRFSSEYFDDELALVYYNFRHYSPDLGRFLSRDPIGVTGGLNVYAFVKNAPTVKRDILGRSVGAPDADVGYPNNPSRPTTTGSNCGEMMKEFMDWFEQEKAKLDDRDDDGKNWIERLPKCPPRLSCQYQTRRYPVAGVMGTICYKNISLYVCKSPNSEEWKITPDVTFWLTQQWGKLCCGMPYHPGGTYELRTRNTDKYDGHGNQCIYDKNGDLITKIPSAGTADWVGPGGSVTEHNKADVKPFETAARLDRECGGGGKYVEMYYQVRPSW